LSKASQGLLSRSRGAGASARRSCPGRTRRGFDDDTRAAYERALELWAIPHFGSMPLRNVERRDVDKLIAKMQRAGLSAHR
jgi:hypothetical protein